MAVTHNIVQESLSWRLAAVNLRSKMQTFIDGEGRALRDLAKARSPVKTGRFKQSWRIKKQVGMAMIASVEVYNPIYSYGRAIEFGVEKKSDHVWAKSAEKASKSRVLESKVEEHKGKIFTKHAPGGVLEPLTPHAYRVQLSQRVADQVIKIVKEAKI